MTQYSKPLSLRLSDKKPRERRIKQWLENVIGDGFDSTGTPIGNREAIVHVFDFYFQHHEDETDIVINTSNDNTDEIIYTLRQEFAQMRRQMNTMKDSLQRAIKEQMRSGAIVVDGLDVSDDEALDEASEKWSSNLFNMFNDNGA